MQKEVARHLRRYQTFGARICMQAGSVCVCVCVCLTDPFLRSERLITERERERERERGTTLSDAWLRV